jgi:uncharacterized membrane protein
VQEPFRAHLIKTLLVGVVIVVPFAITIFVFEALLKFSDTFLFQLLPRPLQPDQLFGFHIPGLGILFTLLILYLAGLVGRNYLGRKAIEGAESFLKEIPLVRGIYFATRKLVETVVEGPSKEKFQRVVLVPFPNRETYMFGFVSGELPPEKPDGEQRVIVFVPTSPNPTSGFVCMFRTSEVIPTTISLEEAFKIILSLGFAASESFRFPEMLSHSSPSVHKQGGG